jgi:hypothetical protein
MRAGLFRPKKKLVALKTRFNALITLTWFTICLSAIPFRVLEHRTSCVRYPSSQSLLRPLHSCHAACVLGRRPGEGPLFSLAPNITSFERVFNIWLVSEHDNPFAYPHGYHFPRRLTRRCEQGPGPESTSRRESCLAIASPRLSMGLRAPGSDSALGILA